MKKIVLILLCTLSLFISCGKKEKGVMTIENKSSHVLDIEFAQNYSSEFIKLQPNDSISRSWERYFHCIIEKPSTNILKRQQTKEKITIFDNDNLYSYTVINGVCPLKILDENQFILAQAVGVPVDSINITQGNNTIKTFIPLSIKNIIFDTSETIVIGGSTYKKIEKIGDDYFLNEDLGGLKSSKIHILFIGNNTIKITK
ncbi:hypothetical protein [Treponema denticola]|uniref:hypothetical protein n=1 Tax=Treponema denticola TaxID=158 RepID=UPI0020A5C192|nr:hypothetical protein [Treponema denticola]UTC92528.1 hypothetical protein E4N84_05260 [Treponema denticola]